MSLSNFYLKKPPTYVKIEIRTYQHSKYQNTKHQNSIIKHKTLKFLGDTYENSN